METTCLIDNGAKSELGNTRVRTRMGSGCGFNPGLERTQQTHSTQQIRGKDHGASGLHDVPSSDTAHAELR